MQESNSAKILRWLQDHYGEHLKILIIPYKRDMWDCFEGIYQLANATDRCSADIMPIPYTFKALQNGQVTWFMDDFTDVACSRAVVGYQNRPQKGDYDIILIHNPYDECNYVTSVHPAFYSSRLKGLARCLGLIPYGVGTVCLITPGVINADVIFTENEQVIESFKSQIKAEGATDEEIELISSKMIHFGSPKFDLDLKQKVPEEWREYIKGKKVVLLTTSIQPFLDDPAQEMVKIGSVISSVSSDPDSVLIWREHPLIKPTIMTMRPEFIEQYGKFQKNYIDQGLGIYDRTNDYRIAFSVADVLYTDPSSLVYVWEQTGKEIHVI